MSLAERRERIDPNSELSVRHQCQLLQLNRSGLYYRPRPTPAEDLALMKRLDRLWTDQPTAGSRTLTALLRQQHQTLVNRKRVQRLMREMGIEGFVPRGPISLSANDEGNIRYPYLLRNLKVDRVNQVWAADITYIPLQTGSAYLVAIVDWYSRAVLAHRLSQTMKTEFCLEALQEALQKHQGPEIFNTDRGGQFTSAEWIDELKGHGVKISMTGTGKCWDNIIVERLWRTVKYEEVYIKDYTGFTEASGNLDAYFNRYNHKRPHSSLDMKTPWAVFMSFAQ